MGDHPCIRTDLDDSFVAKIRLFNEIFNHLDLYRGVGFIVITPLKEVL